MITKTNVHHLGPLSQSGLTSIIESWTHCKRFQPWL